VSDPGALAELGLGAFLGAMLRRLAPLAAGPIACGAPSPAGVSEVRPGYRIGLWGPNEDLGTLDVSLPLAQALSGLVLRGAVAPVELRPLLAVEEAALDALAQVVLADLGMAVGCEPGPVRRAPHGCAAAATLALPEPPQAESEPRRAHKSAGLMRLALSEDAWRALTDGPVGAVWSVGGPLAVVWARVAPAAQPVGPGDVVLPAGWGAEAPERATLWDAGGVLRGALRADWHPPALTWEGVSAAGGTQSAPAAHPEDIVIASLFEGLLARDVPAPLPAGVWVREGGDQWRPGAWCRFEGRRGVLVEG
jgi:hypothetical protein